MPYLLFAYGCAGIGAAGVVVPLLPTTPFLILAAWAASKGSPRLLRRLVRHPVYGPILKAWKKERAIPRRAKILACVLLVFSWAVLVFGGVSGLVLAGVSVFFLLVAGFVLSRPDAGGRRTRTLQSQHR